MFGFIGFILIFILFIVVLALVFLGHIIRSIFGLGKRAPQPQDHKTDYTASASTQKKKKVFDDNEGEYVEFEEVE